MFFVSEDQKPGAKLLLLLETVAAAAAAEEIYYGIIEQTARRLKEYVEIEGVGMIRNEHYEDILRDVFPKFSDSEAQEQDTKQATKTTTASTLEDKVQHEILRGKQKVLITIEKIQNIKQKIKEKLKFEEITEVINKIEALLKHRRVMIILIPDERAPGFPFQWEESTRRLWGNLASALIIITTTNSTQRANKEYCYPPREPIDCSFARLYHDIVLELTSLQKDEVNSYDPQIFRAILDECEPYEFCMKVFAYAMC